MDSYAVLSSEEELRRGLHYTNCKLANPKKKRFRLGFAGVLFHWFVT
jgi:hypothetical protein